jgi:hypothetical protein
MALEVVKESSDVFVPLKSVVGGLSVLLKQYDVSIRLRVISPWLIVLASNSSLIRMMYKD